MFSERTNNIIFLVVLGAVFWFVVSAIDFSALPEGWSVSQNVPGQYTAERDCRVSKTGKASARVASIADSPKGFANLRQEFPPFHHLGRRVRLTAYVKTNIASGCAYLWLQVYGPQGMTQALDDMSDRRIKGITDWTRYEIVLDVPVNARTIAFGFVLSGKGEAWVDDFELNVVGKDVRVTRDHAPRGPVNLGFE